LAGRVPDTLESVNDKEFRQHLAELLARQRNPDQPAKKNPATPELPPKPATMSNKEFRQHLKQLMARQRKEDQPPVEKKPPKSEPPKPTAVIEKKPPAAETSKFKVRRKAK
jgi:hypothetical protein